MDASKEGPQLGRFHHVFDLAIPGPATDVPGGDHLVGERLPGALAAVAILAKEVQEHILITGQSQDVGEVADGLLDCAQIEGIFEDSHGRAHAPRGDAHFVDVLRVTKVARGEATRQDVLDLAAEDEPACLGELDIAVEIRSRVRPFALGPARRRFGRHHDSSERPEHLAVPYAGVGERLGGPVCASRTTNTMTCRWSSPIDTMRSSRALRFEGASSANAAASAATSLSATSRTAASFVAICDSTGSRGLPRRVSCCYRRRTVFAALCFDDGGCFNRQPFLGGLQRGMPRRRRHLGCAALWLPLAGRARRPGPVSLNASPEDEEHGRAVHDRTGRLGEPGDVVSAPEQFPGELLHAGHHWADRRFEAFSTFIVYPIGHQFPQTVYCRRTLSLWKPHGYVKIDVAGQANYARPGAELLKALRQWI